MRSSVLALGALVQCTGSAVHDDDVTLMQTQVRQRVSREIVPDASDIVTAIGAGASPKVASLLLAKLARNSVDTNSSIDEDTKAALESIRETLAGTEQDNIKKSHTEDQDLLNTRYAAFGTCSATLASDQAEDSETQSLVDGNRTSHAECRNNLKELETDRDTKCTFLANFEAGVTVPECSAPGHDRMAEWFTKHLSWVTTTKASWTAANEDCESSTTAYSEKDASCDVMQTQFETDVCHFRVAVHSTCRSYEDCYSTAVDVYSTDLTAIRDRETGRKVDYTAIEKIKCYIDVLISDEENDDRATKMKECEALCAAEDGEANPCTDELTINSHDLPNAQICSLDAVSSYPCLDDFIANEYTAFGFIDLRVCAACPDLSQHLLPSTPEKTWHLVCRNTADFWFTQGQWSLNADDPSNANFAILDKLEDFRRDGAFEFKLVWPDSGLQDQHWSQTSNPVTKTTKGVEGYQAISAPYTSNLWGGLEYGGRYSLLDGSVSHNNWYYSVGSFQKWSSGIPGPAAAVQQVELYVKA